METIRLFHQVSTVPLWPCVRFSFSHKGRTIELNNSKRAIRPSAVDIAGVNGHFHFDNHLPFSVHVCMTKWIFLSHWVQLIYCVSVDLSIVDPYLKIKRQMSFVM